MANYHLILVVFAAMVAYRYFKWQAADQFKVIRDNQLVIRAWQSQIGHPEAGFTRVVVGINVCVDLIVKGTSLLNALHVKPGKQSDHEVLKSLAHLQEAFHKYFHQGSAAERYFTDGPLFSKIVDAAGYVDNAEWNVGGNAALIAQKIAVTFPDIQVHLVGPIGSRVESLLNSQIKVPLHTVIDEDAVHLIMEIEVGDKWGSSEAPVATRFITSHDEANSKAASLDAFLQTIKEVQPNLVVFSGLHMLEGQTPSVWQKQLSAIAEGLNAVPQSIAIHLELASMANAHFAKEAISQIIPFVDSLGLNEQELAFTAQIMENSPRSNIFQKNGQPHVHRVTDVIAWILHQYGRSVRNPASRLTRVHFHSLVFHVIGVIPGAWRNSSLAVAAGTQMASKQACDVDELNPEEIELRVPSAFLLHSGGSEQEFSAENPVTSFEHRDFQFSFSPVLVCKKPLKTVGLGDAISATGLIYSSFSKSQL